MIEKPHPDHVKDSLEAFVESNVDRDRAVRAVQRYPFETPQPEVPRQFDSVEELVDYYEQKVAYDEGLLELRQDAENAKERRRQAARELAHVLPLDTTLHYPYEGERENLRGRVFLIERTQADGVRVAGSR